LTDEQLIQKLVSEDFIEEAKWISDSEFIVWIYYFNLDDFIDCIKAYFGTYPFDDGGFRGAVMFDNMIAIDLCDFLGGCTTEHFSTLFPYDEYQ
jgi:hypothetical protein